MVSFDKNKVVSECDYFLLFSSEPRFFGLIIVCHTDEIKTAEAFVFDLYKKHLTDMLSLFDYLYFIISVYNNVSIRKKHRFRRYFK
jgi:hypothetical protein